MDSAFAKYNRAKKHLEELRSSVEAFREADMSDELSHQVTYPWGDDDPRAVVTLRLQLRAPREWSVIMGDILTNLRASLDHAVYGHATGRHRLNSDQRGKLYHPMLTERRAWEGTPEEMNADGTTREAKPGVRDSLRDLLEPAVLDHIERCQPFNADDDPVWHGLAILSGLVNRDKHRAVLDVPIKLADLVIGDSNVEVLSEEDASFCPGDVVEKVFTIRRALRRPGAAPKYNLGLFRANTVFIEEIEIPRTQDRRAFLTVMETLVEKTGEYLEELKAIGC